MVAMKVLGASATALSPTVLRCLDVSETLRRILKCYEHYGERTLLVILGPTLWQDTSKMAQA